MLTTKRVGERQRGVIKILLDAPGGLPAKSSSPRGYSRTLEIARECGIDVSSDEALKAFHCLPAVLEASAQFGYRARQMAGRKARGRNPEVQCRLKKHRCWSEEACRLLWQKRFPISSEYGSTEQKRGRVGDLPWPSSFAPPCANKPCLGSRSSSRRRFRLSSRGKSREISTSSATVSPRYSFHDAPRVQLLPIEGKRESGKVLNWIASSKEGAGHFDQGREWRLDNTPHTQRVAPQIFGRSTVSVALRGG